MIERRSTTPPFIHKEDIPHRIVVETLRFIYAPIINVEGKENIQMIEELLSNNKRIIVLSNHISNADAEIIRQSLKRLAERLIFLEGEKLRRTPITKFFTRSLNTIFVWPKSLPPQNEKEARKQKAMNIKALRDSREALRNGYVLVTFPEGGRSYEGQLKKAEPEIASYLRLLSNTVVLPVAISGIEKIIPPQKKLVLPNPRQKVTLTAGEPIYVDSFLKQHEGLSREDANAAVTDYIMRRGIAPLLPKEYRGVYA